MLKASTWDYISMEQVTMNVRTNAFCTTRFWNNNKWNKNDDTSSKSAKDVPFFAFLPFLPIIERVIFCQ